MNKAEKITITYVTGRYRLVRNETTEIVGERPGADQFGYGSKITTDIVLQFEEGRKRYRVYCTCWSNIGSLWITVGKKKLYLPTVFQSDLVDTFYDNAR